jgi:hypothetical protein|tara:strand:- start:57 stop:245 length:189 start_codon:yes stop_codon:yes gene_type:complete
LQVVVVELVEIQQEQVEQVVVEEVLKVMHQQLRQKVEQLTPAVEVEQVSNLKVFLEVLVDQV